MTDMKPDKKIVVVIPAYNAEKTLEKTYNDIPRSSVHEIILVDDASTDRTVEIAQSLGVTVITHQKNAGYGANQKTCYKAALNAGADFVVMIHPDYQYDCRVIPYAIGFLDAGICDVVIGSRIRSRKEALQGGMPFYKYIVNRQLTFAENIILGQNIGDCHSGFRAYTRQVLEKICFEHNSDSFVFDTQLLAQAVWCGFRIGDVPIPTRYLPDSSSISFYQGILYTLGTVMVMVQYLLARCRIGRFRLFQCNC